MIRDVIYAQPISASNHMVSSTINDKFDEWIWAPLVFTSQIYR